MIRIGVWGGTGKMGHEVRSLLDSSGSKMKIISPTRSQLEGLSTVDLIIDFSTDEGLKDLLSFFTGRATSKKLPALVSGSTGLSNETLQLLKRYSKKAPTFWSANFSPGVWLLQASLATVLLQLKRFQFDIRIKDIHHRHKRDAPSGTAKVLSKQVIDATQTIPPIESLRLGEIVGVHQVLIESPFEKLTYEHTATNRKVFAAGAISVANWVLEKKLKPKKGPNSIYSMNDFMKPVSIQAKRKRKI